MVNPQTGCGEAFELKPRSAAAAYDRGLAGDMELIHNTVGNDRQHIVEEWLTGIQQKGVGGWPAHPVTGCYVYPLIILASIIW